MSFGVFFFLKSINIFEKLVQVHLFLLYTVFDYFDLVID